MLTAAAALLVMAIGLAAPAHAAALTRVTNFGSNPTNLNMYVYVPDRVAAKPALLVLVHYCGGSASSVFGWNGKDYATAADRYGYIMVLPAAGIRPGSCPWSPTPSPATTSTRRGLSSAGSPPGR